MKNEENAQSKICIVYITTYPPRECGIATFSADLIKYSKELFGGKVDIKVVAMKIGNKEYPYNKDVFLEIEQDTPAQYIEAAKIINNMDEVRAVFIQHEFGIFGKNHGENLIHLLQNLKKPKIITLHTVLEKPDAQMERVLNELISLVDKIVVMTEFSQNILLERHKTPSQKIQIIPHGIHPQLYKDTKAAKRKLKLNNKIILTTFGLLSRGKGMEYAIEALPQIVGRYPEVKYLILGETHPIVREREGEEYREFLMNKVKELNLENNVVFENRYLSTEELLLYLEATDIYLATPQNPNQTVSGTLTYALGAGRAVISTAFMQAKEIIKTTGGVIVPIGESVGFVREILHLLDNPEHILNMGKNAYFYTRNMTWPNVALSYMNVFANFLPAFSSTDKYLLPIKIDHLQKMTDDFGVFQFANLSEPDIAWGYTLDDNARALAALSWFYKISPSAEVENLIKITLEFIIRAAKEGGGFINYFDGKRKPHEELNKSENLEDANARALWALSVVSNSSVPDVLKKEAKKLFDHQYNLHKEVVSPRAAAFYIKAFSENYNTSSNKTILNRVKKYADYLVDLYERTSDKEWRWFEESLNYSNGVLPQALLAAYQITKEEKYLKIATEALDFLLEHSFEGDICVPIGQGGWFKKGKEKKRYDQQPEEVAELTLALAKMVQVGGRDTYKRKMTLTFDWFLGNNVSRQIVYTHFTGGSYDGVKEGGVNLNQGAESTIAYLLARLAMETKEVI